MPMRSAVPFWFSDDTNDNAARVLFSPFVFNTATAPIQGETFTLADVGLNTVQFAFVDNSNSPAPTSITISGTRQTLAVPPFTQGYYRVLGSPLMLDYTIQNFGGVTAAGFAVNVGWMNIALHDGASWPVYPPNGLQGTPFAASASTTAGIASVTMAAQPGRRSFVSELQITGTGATAASEVQATLTNMESVGAAVTMQWSFTAPLGVGVPANALLLTFNPPIPVLAGQSAVLSLPSLGAGGVGTVTMDGFYI